MVSIYDDEAAMRAQIDAGGHRDLIGGMWEEIGALQQRFLLAEGLQPHHRFLDLGCGSFRAGVKLAAYLDPGCYYGIDISPALLDAGYEREVAAAGLTHRLPRENIHATADFTPAWDVQFDYGIAQSLFTHMPSGQLLAALTALRPKFKPGGRFYATYFVAPEGAAEQAHEPGGVTTFRDRDPFHTSRGEIETLARRAQWNMRWIGNWNHPRAQQIVVFERP